MQWTNLAAVRDELVLLVEQNGPRPTVAFDADSTLWFSDVANRLWDRLLGERLLRPESGPHIAAVLRAQQGEPTGDRHRDMEALLDLYARGRADERAVVAVQATGLVGFTEQEVREIARASFASGRPLRGTCFEGMAELIGALRGAGARVVVVSGSPQLVVEEAARLYEIGAEDVSSLRTRVEAGRITAEISGPLTAHEGKLAGYALLSDVPPLAAFGDGASDIPLLRSATGLACMINPRPRLRAATREMPAPVRWIRIARTVSGEETPVPDVDESTIL
jgi:HAD superfamily phosphoserine phosphatase-like hydrolase